jgi:uncharacterized cupin superfamily protein
VAEAPLERTEHGLVPQGDGWFVLNAREAPWDHVDELGEFCSFEGKTRFPQVGININILAPGQPMSMYHEEGQQEDFLVLRGECLLIVEGEERQLRAWDLVHCPAGVPHVIVGAGRVPAVVIGVGARGGENYVVYREDPAAQRHGAGVATETRVPKEAYANMSGIVPRPYRDGDLPDL